MPSLIWLGFWRRDILLAVRGKSPGPVGRSRRAQRVRHAFRAHLSWGQRVRYGFGAHAFASLSFGFRRVPLLGRRVGLLLLLLLLLRGRCSPSYAVFLAQMGSS